MVLSSQESTPLPIWLQSSCKSTQRQSSIWVRLDTWRIETHGRTQILGKNWWWSDLICVLSKELRPSCIGTNIIKYLYYINGALHWLIQEFLNPLMHLGELCLVQLAVVLSEILEEITHPDTCHRSTLEHKSIYVFPELGVSPDQTFLINGIFHYEPTIFGNPIYGNPHMLLGCAFQLVNGINSHAGQSP